MPTSQAICFGFSHIRYPADSTAIAPVKPLIIIRLTYYLTYPLTKIETVTRTS
jgi:hypothetical protein